MSVKSEVEEKLEKSLELSKCPYCQIWNPIIRVVRAYKGPSGWVIIFSCGSCKHIINCGLEGETENGPRQAL